MPTVIYRAGKRTRIANQTFEKDMETPVTAEFLAMLEGVPDHGFEINEDANIAEPRKVASIDWTGEPQIQKFDPSRPATKEERTKQILEIVRAINNGNMNIVPAPAILSRHLGWIVSAEDRHIAMSSIKEEEIQPVKPSAPLPKAAKASKVTIVTSKSKANKDGDSEGESAKAPSKVNTEGAIEV